MPNSLNDHARLPFEYCDCSACEWARNLKREIRLLRKLLRDSLGIGDEEIDEIISSTK